MQVLHGLLESDKINAEQNEQGLLLSAYKAARKRVVVKRPANTPVLVDPLQLHRSYTVEGPTNRWDVYVTN